MNRQSGRPFHAATRVLGLLLAVAAAASLPAAGAAEPQGEKESWSYAVGYRVGGDFHRDGIEVDREILLRGIMDALAGGAPLLSYREMREVLADLQGRVSATRERRLRDEAEANLAAGLAFLEENGAREGVVSLPGGVQYEVVREGSGPSPRPGDTVVMNYRGSLVDGREFDSTYRRGKPAAFRADRVIDGWKEALPLMRQGAKWRLFVPPARAYGDRRVGSIPPNSLLIFDMELLSVQREGGAPAGRSPGGQGW